MGTRWRSKWVLAGVLCIAIAAGSSATVTAVPAGPSLQLATCTAYPTTVEPGETVTLDASSSAASDVESDTDGDGEYEVADQTAFTLDWRYEVGGTYEPGVRVYDGDPWDTASHGAVIVGESNDPLEPAVALSPRPGLVGQQTTFDAANATDPDGRIVEYRWNFDGDGSVDETTSGPRTEHTYADAGEWGAVLTVDDDGATDSSEFAVRVRSGGPFGTIGWPGPFEGLGWLVLAILGGLLGLLICRLSRSGFPWPFGVGSGGNGVTNYATGTFETPPGGGTVAVDGLGFEPDLVLVSATPAVTASGPGLDRTDGWTHGAAKRRSDGTITQQTVGVADDARRTGAGVATAKSGAVLELVVHDDSWSPGLTGSITETTADGFEVAIDADDLPPNRSDRAYVVHFEAFETAAATDAAVGYFTTPTIETVQSVDLGVDADYVRLTTLDPLGETNAAVQSADRVGISHGRATGGDALSQHAVAGAVDSSTVGHTCYSAYDDRALHLLHGASGAIDGRTSARVTGLGERLELTYDAVFDGAEERAGGAEDAFAPDAPPRLVSYVALDTGDGPSPEVGALRPPDVDAGRARVDVGFEPRLIEFTAATLDSIGTEQCLATSPLGFGWSCGSALVDRCGTVDHAVLHNSIDGDGATGTGPVSTPLTRSESGAVGAATRPWARGGVLPSDGRPPASPDGGTPAARTGTGGSTAAGDAGRAGAGALGFVVDDDGRIRRRLDLRVTGVDRTGFAVETRRLGDATGDDPGLQRPVVFYTAWPRTGGEP